MTLDIASLGHRKEAVSAGGLSASARWFCDTSTAFKVVSGHRLLPSSLQKDVSAIGAF